MKSTDTLQYHYQTLLLSCFRVACEAMRDEKRKNALQQALDKISSKEIWKYICGSEIDGVTNEIAFYNEKLKHACISFCLKEGQGYLIDQIFRLFREFICVGDLKEGRVHFTVTYEQFYYRKIHMLLMVIVDKIDNISPDDVADVIAARVKNKERNSWTEF